MRAPHGADHRQGACRLSAGRQGRRPVQDRSRRRYLCPAPADPGSDDRSDRRRHPGCAQSARRRRHARGRAYVHGHARHPQGRLDDADLDLHRRLQGHPRGTGPFRHHGAGRQGLNDPRRPPAMVARKNRFSDLDHGQTTRQSLAHSDPVGLDEALNKDRRCRQWNFRKLHQTRKHWKKARSFRRASMPAAWSPSSLPMPKTACC
ncbi:hypothetical protein MES4922_30026 [Mesorhizobium ventifaucium]|uniref:Uncharacterized protein n=1 Tax=Mesorhizobium ventifaucium TaxID=666020 RepID=A0ABM9DX75_9HYPH|nr:hypothetical protein MES4922_30026 [Mesorhizobium ventifaucium]